MELKTNVTYNVAIDPELLLSYEPDKFSLENVSNDTFEKSEESSKCDEHRDIENLHIQGNKSTRDTFSQDSPNIPSETVFTVKKLSTNIMIGKALPDTSERWEDINGNKEPDEDINNLLHNLRISDFDNEQDDSSEESENKEENKDPSLRERQPTPKLFKNKRQAPYDKQKNDNHATICFSDLYGNSSQSNPWNIVDYLLNTSEGGEPNETVSPDHQFNDHATNFGDNNAHKQNKDINSDYGIIDSCLEDCRVSSVSSPESDCDPFFTSNLDLDHYISDINDKAFWDGMDELLFQLPDCDSTACNFSGNGEIIPESLQATTNKGEAETAHVVKSNKIRKNDLVNIRTSNVTTLKTPIQCGPFRDTAKAKFKAFLCDDKRRAAERKIYGNVIEQMSKESKTKDNVKVIYIEDEGNNYEKRSNLHNAVLNSELEEIYCLVEIHMKYSNQSPTELNLLDRHGKTAIDYAIQNNIAAVVEYLREKNCCPSLNI